MSELDPHSIRRLTENTSNACHLNVVEATELPGGYALEKTPGFAVDGIDTIGLTKESIVFFNYLRRMVIDRQSPHFPDLGQHMAATYIKTEDGTERFVQRPIPTDEGKENMARRGLPEQFDPEQFAISRNGRTELVVVEADCDLELVAKVFKDIVGFYALSKRDPRIAHFLDEDEGLYLEGHKPNSWVRESDQSLYTPGKIHFVDGHPIFPLTTDDVHAAKNSFFGALEAVVDETTVIPFSRTSLAPIKEQTERLLDAA